MYFLRLTHHMLAHIFYGIMLIFTFSCSKLFSTLTINPKNKLQKQTHISKVTKKKYKILSTTSPTKLCWASFFVEKKTINWLLHNPNFDVAKLDRFGRNILHGAFISKCLWAVQYILYRLPACNQDKLKKLINQLDCFEYAALHYLFVDNKEPYTQNHWHIFQEVLRNPDFDINIKDGDNLPMLYWLIKYRHINFAEKILISQQLETFRLFISRQLHQPPNGGPCNFHSCHKLSKISKAVRDILNEFISFLKVSNPSDPKLRQVQELLLNKYFSLAPYQRITITKEIDILNIMKRAGALYTGIESCPSLCTDSHDQEMTVASPLDQNQMDVLNEHYPEADELFTDSDLHLALPSNSIDTMLGFYDLDIDDKNDLLPNQTKDSLDRVIYNFIDKMCGTYADRTKYIY